MKVFLSLRLACQCDKRAKEANYAGFALMFYGECHGKTKEQLEELESQSHQQHLCVGDQKYTHCDKEKHEHCTGKEFAEAVFKFRSPDEKSKEIGFSAIFSTCKSFLKLVLISSLAVHRG